LRRKFQHQKENKVKIKKYLPDRNRQLLDYQRRALAWGLRQNNPAWFIDMRLGKSLLTIEWVLRKNLKRVLVLCPKTAIVSWVNELRLEGIKPHILETPQDKFEASRFEPETWKDGWFLTNFQTILTVPLFNSRWDCIVIDESSKMKSPKALLTKRLLQYYKSVPHKILLSGTPTPESISESITQLIFKDGSCLDCRDYWTFRFRYMHLEGYDWILNPGVYDRLKTALHHTAYFLSQKAAGWDTTEKREVISFTLNEIQKKHIKELLKHFETTIGTKTLSTKYVLPQTLWMSRIASGYLENAILNPAKELWLLNHLKENPTKHFIIWFRFNEELFRIQKILEGEGIPHLALWGVKNLLERIDAQSQFQAGKIRLLLLQTKLGQFSLNLSKADASIYFSNSYSLEERIQSEKRISHMERTIPPHYIDLIFEKSIEKEILEMLKNKTFSFRMLWVRLKSLTEE